MTPPFQIKIVARGSKRSLGTVELKDDTSVDALQRAFHTLHPRWYPDRQWFTDATSSKQRLEADKLLDKDYGLKSGDTVVFKDLGPQVGWKTVFLVEYAGPLVIHPVLYCASHLVYGQHVAVHSPVQQWAFWMILAHFVKRELETL
jgi:very-long-chain enoyl-CoA reductase